MDRLTEQKLLTSLKRFAGVVIPLGVKHQPLDYSGWRRHCRDRLGRELPFGEPLQREDMARLGFIEAAVKLER